MIRQAVNYTMGAVLERRRTSRMSTMVSPFFSVNTSESTHFRLIVFVSVFVCPSLSRIESEGLQTPFSSSGPKDADGMDRGTTEQTTKGMSVSLDVL